MADHCSPPTPDDCFGCKVRYWRRHGAPGVIFQGGRDQFHNSTIPERQRKIVAEAAANGVEARLVHPVYDRPANFGPTAAEKREKERKLDQALRTAIKEVRGVKVGAKL